MWARGQGCVLYTLKNMCVGAVFFEIPSSTEEYSFHILDVYNQLNPRTCQAGMILLAFIRTATCIFDSYL